MNHIPQRLDIAYAIHWETGWHVGSGQGTAAVDRLLRKRARGPSGERVSYVPGSQIKGVLRHQCERLVVMLGGEVVSPHFSGGAPADELLNGFRPQARSTLLIERLFGSRFQGDCLFADDALPKPNDPHHKRKSFSQSRSSIDRVTGCSRNQALFVTEVAQADGSLLQGSLHCRHPVKTLTQDGDRFPFEYALLLAGLLNIDALGGDKSAGLGKCWIEISDDEHVRWNGKRWSLVEALNSFKDPDWFGMVELIREDEDKP